MKPYDELLPRITLSKGPHASPDTGMCVMEAAAYISGRKHSDAPGCVSASIRTACMNLNDSLATDEERNRYLSGLVFDVIGTAMPTPIITEVAGRYHAKQVQYSQYCMCLPVSNMCIRICIINRNIKRLNKQKSTLTEIQKKSIVQLGAVVEALARACVSCIRAAIAMHKDVHPSGMEFARSPDTLPCLTPATV